MTMITFTDTYYCLFFKKIINYHLNTKIMQSMK